MREAALEGGEPPHSIAVTVEEMEPRAARRITRCWMHVNLYVERESQKYIIIAAASNSRKIGTKALSRLSDVSNSHLFEYSCGRLRRSGS